jgi:hypothetical protein
MLSYAQSSLLVIAAMMMSVGRDRSRAESCVADF